MPIEFHNSKHILLEISSSNCKCISGILQVEILSNCKTKTNDHWVAQILCKECCGDLRGKEIKSTASLMIWDKHSS